MDPSTAEPTNVLLVLTDQERYDLSGPDGPTVETPATDRLQREGMRFDRAYTPISICSSARASLLTGLYPHNHGMLNNCHEPDAILANLPEELVTFGELLRDAGYTNSYAGKWHVGRDRRPADFGFRYLGGGDGHHGTPDPRFQEYQRSHGVDPDDVPVEDPIYVEYENGERDLLAAETTAPKEAMRPYYIAEVTIRRLQACAELDAPFFHRTDFAGPHHPYLVPEPYASMYDPDDIEPWANYAEPFEHKPRAHEQYRSYRGVDEFAWETWAAVIARYFGFVTFIEEQVARVLDALEASGLVDETAVFRTADHGDFVGSHRQFNKGPMMYEETYHVPLSVRWPDVVDPGSTCDAFVRLLDLMPTFLELGGVGPPEGIDGRSIVPLLRGEFPADWPRSVFAEYHGEEFGLYSQRMVRTPERKYVYNGPDTNELYDLQDDPHELRNRIDDPAYRDVRVALQTALVEWMDRTDDPLVTWVARTLERREPVSESSSSVATDGE